MAPSDLREVDLRALRLFQAVAEGGGYAAAQAVMGVAQSTLSERIARLEDELGVRLCERGRRGFRLTDEGREVFEAGRQLFSAVDDFRLRTGELGGRLSGRLTIGVIDNTITDPHSPVVPAIQRFEARGHDVLIDLSVGSPTELERSVVNGECQLALGTFPTRVPGLRYSYLYSEEHVLCCGRGHPVFDVKGARKVAARLRRARIVTAPYFAAAALVTLGVEGAATTVENVEACAMLLLTGGYVGYLPHHFAQRWIDAGELRELLPGRRHTFPIELVTPATGTRSRAARAFLTDLRGAVAGARGE